MPDWINNLIWLGIGTVLGMIVFLVIVVIALGSGKDDEDG